MAEGHRMRILEAHGASRPGQIIRRTPTPQTIPTVSESRALMTENLRQHNEIAEKSALYPEHRESQRQLQEAFGPVDKLFTEMDALTNTLETMLGNPDEFSPEAAKRIHAGIAQRVNQTASALADALAGNWRPLSIVLDKMPQYQNNFIQKRKRVEALKNREDLLILERKHGAGGG